MHSAYIIVRRSHGMCSQTPRGASSRLLRTRHHHHLSLAGMTRISPPFLHVDPPAISAERRGPLPFIISGLEVYCVHFCHQSWRVKYSGLPASRLADCLGYFDLLCLTLVVCVYLTVERKDGSLCATQRLETEPCLTYIIMQISCRHHMRLEVRAMPRPANLRCHAAGMIIT
jgi:hypothetical protein